MEIRGSIMKKEEKSIGVLISMLINRGLVTYSELKYILIN